MNEKHMLVICAFLGGFAIMLFEIAGARALYPFFGSSLLIWTAIIGIFMVTLALGYYYGGKISASRGAASRIGGYVAAGGAFSILLPLLVELTASARFVPWQATLFLSSLFVALPSLALAMVGPLLIESNSRGKAAGISAGEVYGVSTVGSIFGSFICGFALLPFLGVKDTLVLGGLISIVLGFIMMREIRPGPVIAAMLLVPVMAGYASGGIPTYFYTANVLDKDGSRFLLLDGQYESGLNLSNYSNPVFGYTKIIKSHIDRLNVSKAAIIGAGGCTQVYYIRDANPDAEIYVVDIDPVLFGICKNNFMVSEDGKTHFVNEDGRQFLKNNSGFDLIVLDAYGSRCNVPSHMITVEFFKELGGALAGNGTMAANIIMSRDARMRNVVCGTVADAMGPVSCEYANGNKSINMVITYPSSGAGYEYASSDGEIITDDRNPIELEYAGVCSS